MNITINDDELKAIAGILTTLGTGLLALFRAFIASKDAQITAKDAVILAERQRADRAEKQRDELQIASSVAIGAGHAMLELTGGHWPPMAFVEEKTS